MRRMIWLIFSMIAMIAAPVGGAWAYEGGAVSNGGTISGVVKFKGMAPTSKPLMITKDKSVCGKTPKTDPTLVVKDGNVEYAVVSLTDIKTGKKMEPMKVTLNQKGCEYHPHVLGLTAGSTVEILNPDGILHNVHSYSKVNSPFNRAQPKFKKKLSVKISKPEIIHVQCDVHGWMTGYLFVSGNPYFSVTNDQGAFSLSDVPPGTYNLEVWHETLGKKSQKVTVGPKQDVKVTFELSKG